jgi:hypothetical protein
MKPTIIPDGLLNRPFFVFLIFAAVALSVYANSVTGSFLWDDHTLIENNLFIKNWRYLPDIFLNQLGSGAGTSGMLYRPIQVLTYMIDYRFYRLSPAGYHITNIILHLLSGWFLFKLLRTVLKDSKVSFFSALLFLVHPVQTEAVSYISGRADSLAALFIILSFIYYLRILRADNGSNFALMMLFFALALFSRENALIFPVAIGLYSFIYGERFLKKEFFAVCGLCGLYILFRFFVIGVMPGEPGVVFAFRQRMTDFFAALFGYFRLLIFPVDLHMEYRDNPFAISDIRVIAGAVISVSLPLFSLILRKRAKVYSYGLFWFFIFLIPHSNIYPINAYMAEHWLYLPSAGFFVILSKAVFDALGKKSLNSAVIVLLAITVVFGAVTISQNFYWSGEIGFY